MAVSDAQIRDLLGRTFPSGGQPQEGATVDAGTKPRLLAGHGRHGGPEYVSAYQLIQKASETFDALQERYRRLDAEMRKSNERFRSELHEAERVIKDWERLATGLKAQLERSEAHGAELQQRLTVFENRVEFLETELKASEDRLAASQALLEEAERRARAAEDLAAEEIKLAASFREKIAETFNPGRLSAAFVADPES